MASFKISLKRVQIDKANTQMVIILAAASVISVFSLVAAKTLWGQSGYQSRVLSSQRKANSTLDDDIKAADQLKTDYELFAAGDPNVLGGSRTGSGALDGANQRITLDALPSKYDFPAFASSMEKLFKIHNIKDGTFSAVDEELQQSSATSTSSDPVPYAINFTIAANSDLNGVKSVINDMEKSIRPFKFSTLTLSGTDSVMNMNASVIGYYQPAKTINISTKVVK